MNNRNIWIIIGGIVVGYLILFLFKRDGNKSPKSSMKHPVRNGSNLAPPYNQLVASVFTCVSCGQKYTPLGRRGDRAVGGAECRSCGKFYCQSCVNKVLGGHSPKKTFACACGRSRTKLSNEGHWEFDNFKELVLYRT